MPTQIDVSPEALKRLQGAMREAQHSTMETLSSARRRGYRAQESGQKQIRQLESQIESLRYSIQTADEDESTAEYEENLEATEDALRERQEALSKVQAALQRLESIQQPLIQTATTLNERGQKFLLQQIENLAQYAALRPDSDGWDSGSGSPVSGAGSSGGGIVKMPFGRGLRKAAPDPRDWLWKKHYGPLPDSLPLRINLESGLGPVSNQGETPTCVAHSLAALKRYDSYLASQELLTIDPAGLYTACKARDGAPNEDGTTIRDAMKVGVKDGFRDNQGARQFIKAYVRLESADDMRHALSKKKPVVVGVQVGRGLMQIGEDSVGRAEPGETGGHAMVVVGYDDAQQWFRVRNSWGSAWADYGHCYLPYSWFASDALYDAWTTADELASSSSPVAVSPINKLPAREVSVHSNFAWVSPADIVMGEFDLSNLEWKPGNIPQDVAVETLLKINELREYFSLEELNNGLDSVLAAIPNAGETERRILELYFSYDKIRIDVASEGRLDVMNGRHRLWIAQQLGIPSIPVSLSNRARSIIAKKIEEDSSYGA